MTLATVLKTLLIVFIFIVFSILLGIAIKRTISYFEDNPHSAKGIVELILYTGLALHILLYILGFPIKFVFLSILGQILYISLFHEYPDVTIKDARFVIGAAITIYSHFYFAAIKKRPDITGKGFLFGYLVIWTNPLVLCLVLCAKQNVFVLNGITRRRAYRLFKFLDIIRSKKNKNIRPVG